MYPMTHSFKTLDPPQKNAFIFIVDKSQMAEHTTSDDFGYFRVDLMELHGTI